MTTPPAPSSVRTSPAPPARPLRIALVGSGPWAQRNHAPLLARVAHRRPGEVEFAGVWARRPESARDLADAHGVPAFTSLEEMLAACDAVDLAVPPQVQAPIALRAAGAGKHLMLEKPVAGSLAEARELAAAVARARVASVVGLTRRYAPSTRAFLAEAHELLGGASVAHLQGSFFHGGMLVRGYHTESANWRAEDIGPLFNLGAHLVDLALAAAGPAVTVRAANAAGTALTTIDLHHADGAVSQLAVSMSIDVPMLHELHVHTDRGVAHWSIDSVDGDAAWDTTLDEFLAAARDGSPVTVDVHDGLRIQAVLEAATRSLRGGGEVAVEEVAGPPRR